MPQLQKKYPALKKKSWEQQWWVGDPVCPFFVLSEVSFLSTGARYYISPPHRTGSVLNPVSLTHRHTTGTRVSDFPQAAEHAINCRLLLELRAKAHRLMPRHTNLCHVPISSQQMCSLKRKTALEPETQDMESHRPNPDRHKQNRRLVCRKLQCRTGQHDHILL